MDMFRFPEMSRGNLRAMRQTIDGAFRDFTRAWGDTLEAIFEPLQDLLTLIENLLLRSPWALVLVVLAAGIWLLSRSGRIALGSVLALLLVGYFGMWEDTMRTIAMVLVCTLIAVVMGIPVGIVMAQSNRASGLVTPILDMMQTMPSFVYLIPVVMIFGLGKVPG